MSLRYTRCSISPPQIYQQELVPPSPKTTDRMVI